MKRRVLALLKVDGPQTARAISGKLKTDPTTVQQALASLRRDKLATGQPIRPTASGSRMLYRAAS